MYFKVFSNMKNISKFIYPMRRSIRTLSQYQIFSRKHIGIQENKVIPMLRVMGSSNTNQLMNESLNFKGIKPEIKLDKLPPLETEEKVNADLYQMMKKNKKNTSLIGLGYHNTRTPFPIQRHVLENPKWYTAYTPYQAEISQGRLEAQYNFQEVIQELTGLPIANSSLLDEGSTAAEVLNMCFHYKNKNQKRTFLVSSDLHPQVLGVLKLKADILGVNLVELDFKKWDNYVDITLWPVINFEDVFGIMLAYPGSKGDIYIPQKIINLFQNKKEVSITCAADPLSLMLLPSPESIGIDICFGSAQRLGVPLFYGGPHPAFLAAKKEYLRLMPGRIVGKSQDSIGKPCYRLALQTREQHIKKQKATSNICTSQSLLANVVGFYCYYHGRDGLREISEEVHMKALTLNHFISQMGLKNQNRYYFDTLHFKSELTPQIYQKLLEKDIIINQIDLQNFSLSVDETLDNSVLRDIINTVSEVLNPENLEKIKLEDINSYQKDITHSDFQLPQSIRDLDSFLPDKFENGKTETEFLRYIHQLTKKDYTLCEGMIPLGSCTMKLNATYQLNPLSWSETQNYHPFLPREYVLGYHQLFKELGDFLKDITGFQHISYQSNSGAMGEYSGLLCIRKYHLENGDRHRKICIIPKSAHGTNFASAQLAGLEVVSYDDTESIEELEKVILQHRDNLGAIMITYPGTNGIFQDNIVEICDLVHQSGGLVYMDGANMNAQVGLIKPALCGADVCHLNLHKTFCIPHGGGGPGMGPILCNDKLKDYLPTNILQVSSEESQKSIGMITSSQWSSASLLTIPYSYIRGMGQEGLKQASEMAILNANYLKDCLKDDFQIVDVNTEGRVGHEFIIDISDLKEKYKITETDIAKRLMDYSFHPPTMSWPRGSVLMFEPTESENREELDRLVRALKSIKQEIIEITEENRDNNILKNAPHSLDLIKNWPYEYSTVQAYYPLPELEQNKFWPYTNRIDDLGGDRNLLSQK